MNRSISAILVLPLIFRPTRSGVTISHCFFYAVYPAHLALIALVRNLM